LHEETRDGVNSNFCIGVAGYPEKHFEAPNMKSDLKFLKAKIDAGASYVVTQMFFDNEKYFDFVKQCRALGIQVPIIPGLKPLTKRSQLTTLPRTFYVNIPDELSEAVEKCKSDKEVRQVGIEWCIQQSKELMAAGVPVIHYYTLGSVKTIREVVSNVF